MSHQHELAKYLGHSMFKQASKRASERPVSDDGDFCDLLKRLSESEKDQTAKSKSH